MNSSQPKLAYQEKIQITTWLLTLIFWVPLWALAMEDTRNPPTASGYVTPTDDGRTPLRVSPERFKRDLQHLQKALEPVSLQQPGLNRYDSEPLFRYLTPEEKESCLVQIGENDLYFASSPEVPIKGQFIYFLDMDDRLYLWPADVEPGTICHSSFDSDVDPQTRSGCCQMAGELMIFNWRVTKKIIINNDSGHYKPGQFGTPNRTERVKTILKEKGFSGFIDTSTQGF